eukprot:2246600-Amphidinium_carterae.2
MHHDGSLDKGANSLIRRRIGACSMEAYNNLRREIVNPCACVLDDASVLWVIQFRTAQYAPHVTMAQFGDASQALALV